jgi:hypothetical protein
MSTYEADRYSSNKAYYNSNKLFDVINSLKVGLHSGDYRSKLVRFEAQKNILCT